MTYLIKTALVLFLISWSALGVWAMFKYAVIFGPHRDDPAESAGARSYNLTNAGSVWFGALALAFYFLFFK